MNYKANKKVSKPNTRFCFTGNIFSPSASGRIISELINASRKIEAAVSCNIRPSYLHQENFPVSDFIKRIANRPDTGRVRILTMPLFSLPKTIERGEYRAITWFDPVNPPSNLASFLTNVKKIWVPSQAHFQACLNSGVPDKKLNKFNITVNTKHFSPKSRCPQEFATDKKFRFITVLSPQKRKGIRQMLEAYLDEFKPGESVELVLKLTHIPKQKKLLQHEISDLKKRLGAINSMFPSVTVIDKTMTDLNLAGLLASSNAYVSTNSSYNTALTVKEAMSCALPVIGPAKVLNDLAGLNEDTGYPVNTLPGKIGENALFPGSLSQNIEIINTSELKSCMRKAFEQSNHTRKKGLAARRLIKKLPEWKDIAAQILQ